MPAFRVSFKPSQLLDAYVDEAQPTSTLGLSDSSRLVVGRKGVAGNRSIGWVAFNASPLPAGAKPLRVLYRNVCFVPATLTTSPAVSVCKCNGSYAESTITYNSASSTEGANWPPATISTQTLDVSFVHSDPTYPIGLPTHVQMLAEIDATAWFNDATIPQRGFFLQVDAFGSPLTTSKVYFLSRESLTRDVRYLDLPRVRFDYGFPVTTLQASEIFDISTRLYWTPSQGADYYQVQLSQDAGVTWYSLDSVQDPWMNLDGLTPDFDYQARVASGYRGFGLCGSYSSTLSFSTVVS